MVLGYMLMKRTAKKDIDDLHSFADAKQGKLSFMYMATPQIPFLQVCMYRFLFRDVLADDIA